jgi:hypothetical protein
VTPDDEQRQARLDQYRSSLKDCAAIPAIKELVAARTKDPTWRTVCPPLVPLSPSRQRNCMPDSTVCQMTRYRNVRNRIDLHRRNPWI